MIQSIKEVYIITKRAKEMKALIVIDYRLTKSRLLNDSGKLPKCVLDTKTRYSSITGTDLEWTFS